MEAILSINSQYFELFISTCMLLITTITAISSYIMNWQNIKMMKQYHYISMLPKHNIICSTYDSIIHISIRNAGHGLMILKKIKIEDKENGNTYVKAEEILAPEINLKYYSVFDKEYTLRPGEHITLLKTHQLSKEQMQVASEKLRNCIIEILYEDAYNIDHSGYKELKCVFRKV